MDIATPPLKGLRNGLYYGGKVRFLHSLIMTLLFKKLDKKAFQQMFKMAWEHARNLGTFVFFYKLSCILLEKLYKKSSLNNFLAGLICGYFVFGKKTPVNYQIVLYLFSRITVALADLIYKSYIADHPSKTHIQKVEKKWAYPIFAALCWGIVMWLFEIDKSTLQASLTSSMEFLYNDSNKPLENWRELVPFYVPF